MKPFFLSFEHIKRRKETRKYNLQSSPKSEWLAEWGSRNSSQGKWNSAPRENSEHETATIHTKEDKLSQDIVKNNLSVKNSIEYTFTQDLLDAGKKLIDDVADSPCFSRKQVQKSNFKLNEDLQYEEHFEISNRSESSLSPKKNKISSKRKKSGSSSRRKRCSGSRNNCSSSSHLEDQGHRNIAKMMVDEPEILITYEGFQMFERYNDEFNEPFIETREKVDKEISEFEEKLKKFDDYQEQTTKPNYPTPTEVCEEILTQILRIATSRNSDNLKTKKQLNSNDNDVGDKNLITLNKEEEIGKKKEEREKKEEEKLKEVKINESITDDKIDNVIQKEEEEEEENNVQKQQNNEKKDQINVSDDDNETNLQPTSPKIETEQDDGNIVNVIQKEEEDNVQKQQNNEKKDQITNVNDDDNKSNLQPTTPKIDTEEENNDKSNSLKTTEISTDIENNSLTTNEVQQENTSTKNDEETELIEKKSILVTDKIEENTKIVDDETQ